MQLRRSVRVHPHPIHIHIPSTSTSTSISVDPHLHVYPSLCRHPQLGPQLRRTALHCPLTHTQFKSASTLNKIRALLASAQAGIAYLNQDKVSRTLVALNATKAHVRLMGSTDPNGYPLTGNPTCGQAIPSSAFVSLNLGDPPRGNIRSSGLSIFIDEGGIYSIGASWGQAFPTSSNPLFQAWIRCNTITEHISPTLVAPTGAGMIMSTHVVRFIPAGSVCTVYMCYGRFVSAETGDPFTFWATLLS
jgi:hypothetical protein